MTFIVFDSYIHWDAASLLCVHCISVSGSLSTPISYPVRLSWRDVRPCCLPVDCQLWHVSYACLGKRGEWHIALYGRNLFWRCDEGWRELSDRSLPDNWSVAFSIELCSVTVDYHRSGVTAVWRGHKIFYPKGYLKKQLPAQNPNLSFCFASSEVNVCVRCQGGCHEYDLTVLAHTNKRSGQMQHRGTRREHRL